MVDELQILFLYHLPFFQVDFYNHTFMLFQSLRSLISVHRTNTIVMVLYNLIGNLPLARPRNMMDLKMQRYSVAQ